MEGLPDELLLKIFRYLRPVELANIAEVCQSWARVAEDPSLNEDLELLKHIANIERIRDTYKNKITDLHNQYSKIIPDRRLMDKYIGLRSEIIKCIIKIPEYKDTLIHTRDYATTIIDNQWALINKQGSIKTEISEYHDKLSDIVSILCELNRIREIKKIYSYDVFYNIKCMPSTSKYSINFAGLFSTWAKAKAILPENNMSNQEDEVIWTYKICKLSVSEVLEHPIRYDIDNLDKPIPDFPYVKK